MKSLLWLYAALLVLLAVVLMIPDADAQTAILLPDPHPQFFDVNGNPLAGGKIFTYLAGTAIAQQTYTDSTGTTLNSNPIVLDSAGFPSCSGSSCGIYLVNGGSYRIVVQNSLGVQQWVADNVKLVNSAQVGGANTQVQYNCAGAFCGSPNFTWNNGSQTLTVTALAVNAGGTLAGSFGGNPVFTGTVTFSGTVNFAAITANSLTSSCANAASAGFIRMCKTDQVNWRNNGNTADFGISASADANDIQILSAPGGLELTGANPNLRFGGTANTFPMLKRSATELQARLADDSASSPFSASTLTFNGRVADPAAVTIAGACSTGQILTATSATAMSCQTPGAAILAQFTKEITVGVALPNSNTTVTSQAITMPSVGCPCRAIASYGVILTTGNSGQDACMVSDGTNNWDTQQVLTTGAASNYGLAGTAAGKGTYTNGAVVTFSLVCAGNHAGGSTASPAAGIGPALTGAQGTWLNVVIEASN